MGLRIRLGPFTFGRTGTRLSFWANGIGVSTPLSGKGRTLGRIGFGPISWQGGLSRDSASLPKRVDTGPTSYAFTSVEVAALEAFRADKDFLQKLEQHGLPWRGVQERLKAEFPRNLASPDPLAFDLVPKAMSAVFGQQGVAWDTVKRPSKCGDGSTTWIVIK